MARFFIVYTMSLWDVSSGQTGVQRRECSKLAAAAIGTSPCTMVIRDLILGRAFYLDVRISKYKFIAVHSFSLIHFLCQHHLFKIEILIQNWIRLWEIINFRIWKCFNNNEFYVKLMLNLKRCFLILNNYKYLFRFKLNASLKYTRNPCSKYRTK